MLHVPLSFGIVLLCLFVSPSHAADTAQELTIAGGLKLATDNSRIVRIAAYNKDISYADTLSARSRLLPSVNASASQTYLSYQPGAVMGLQKVYTSEKRFLSYGINAYQTIYDFGSNTSQYEASKTSLDLSGLDILRTKNIVALDFIITYYDILEAEKMVSVAEKEVQRLESHLSVAQSLFKEGVITKNDLLQTEVRLADAKQRLLTAKNMRELGASRLNSIMSRPLMSEVRVMETDRDFAPNLVLDTLWETAGRQRIEVRTIDSELKIAELEEKSKLSEYYPKLFAQGGYNYTENEYQLHENNWSFLLGVNINLFNGGSTKASVAKAKHRIEQIHERKRKIVDDIKLEVQKGFLDAKNAAEKVRVSKGAIGQAEENHRINKIRYEEGIGTATDVLDAITLLTNAETNHYKALYELRRAHAAVMYAVGMDLVSEYK